MSDRLYRQLGNGLALFAFWPSIYQRMFRQGYTCILFDRDWSMHARYGMPVCQMTSRFHLNVCKPILRARWTTPKHELLEVLDWPSLRWRRSVACVVYLHRLPRQGTAQNALLSNSLFPFHCSVSSRDVRKPYQLILPHARTSSYVKSFFYHSSLSWNMLPPHYNQSKVALNLKNQ